MGVLNQLKNHFEETNESQFDLFDNSQEIKVRSSVNGATVRGDFTKEIKAKERNETAYRDSTKAMTHELFDCKSQELYKKTE